MNNTPLKLKIDQNIIHKTSNYTYLGVTLDEHLSFDNHVKKTIGKVSAKILQLRKIRPYISQKAAVLIYKNMILPIMEYGDVYVPAAKQELRKKMQTLQNRALKCALSKDKRYSTQLLHTEARIKILKTRRKQHTFQHLFQISKHKDFQGWKKTTTTITTRQNVKHLMKIAKPNTTKYQKSLAYKGPKLWNTLTLELMEEESYETFKTKLGSYLKRKEDKKKNTGREQRNKPKQDKPKPKPKQNKTKQGKTARTKAKLNKQKNK